jgi:hypothetical protein
MAYASDDNESNRINWFSKTKVFMAFEMTVCGRSVVVDREEKLPE